MTRRETIAFYEKYKKHLYNASLRIVSNSMDAEEIMQDTIIKYIKSGMQLVNQQEEAWLIKTCVRASIDCVRRKNSQNAFLESYKEEAAESQLEAENSELWGAIGGASEDSTSLIELIKTKMVELSQGYRTVLSLILFEGFDYEEAAQIMGIKEATVRSQYLRGRIQLAKMINNR